MGVLAWRQFVAHSRWLIGTTVAAISALALALMGTSMASLPADVVLLVLAASAAAAFVADLINVPAFKALGPH